MLFDQKNIKRVLYKGYDLKRVYYEGYLIYERWDASEPNWTTWLDASNAGSVTVDHGNKVFKWEGTSGGISFESHYIWAQPRYEEQYIKLKKRDHMISTQPIVNGLEQTIFIIARLSSDLSNNKDSIFLKVTDGLSVSINGKIENKELITPILNDNSWHLIQLNTNYQGEEIEVFVDNVKLEYKNEPLKNELNNGYLILGNNFWWENDYSFDIAELLLGQNLSKISQQSIANHFMSEWGL